MNIIFILFRVLSVTLIFYFIVACKQKTTNVESEAGGAIEVDEQDINNVSIDDLFSDVRLIPLETQSEAAIKQADKIIFHHERFYVLDKDQAAVLVFSSEGKYLFKIRSVGRGPGEYSLLYDININEFKNTIELLNPRGQILAYDLDGNFLDKTTIPVRACHFFQYLNSDTIILYTKFDPKKLAYFSKQKNEIVYTLFSFPDFILETPLIQMSSPFVKYGNELIFFQGFSNTIYSFKGTEMNERFTWNFGDHNLKLKEFPEDESMQFYINFLKKSDYVWGFTNYAENEKIIITRFIYDQNLYSVVYNKQIKDHILVRKVTEDVYFPAVYILTEDKLITSIEPSKIQLLIKPDMLDERQAQIYNSINPEDNPVIIIYTLK